MFIINCFYLVEQLGIEPRSPLRARGLQPPELTTLLNYSIGDLNRNRTGLYPARQAGVLPEYYKAKLGRYLLNSTA